MVAKLIFKRYAPFPNSQSSSMKNLVLSCAVLLASTWAAASGLPSIAEVKSVTDAVMDKVAKGDLAGGLNTFKSLTIIPPAEFDAMVGQAVMQMPVMTSRYGATLDQEFIKEARIGNSLAELVYIHRFDKHAMRWQFYLYRGKDGWVINTFHFDDRWPELFDGK